MYRRRLLLVQLALGLYEVRDYVTHEPASIRFHSSDDAIIVATAIAASSPSAEVWLMPLDQSGPIRITPSN